MSQTIYISLTSNGPVPPDTTSIALRPGDKVRWVNDTGSVVNTFNLPTCVAPQSNPAPIQPNVVTRAFTVNQAAHGSYAYNYATPLLGAQNGTIDVS